MKKRRARLISGIAMILCGIMLLLTASVRKVELVVNGESRIVRTMSSRVYSILEKAGVPWDAADHIRPGLTERVGNGARISLDRAVPVTLETAESRSPRRFTTWQHFGGNILLDAGIRIFPGDRLYWNETEIRPDFNLANIPELSLRLAHADSFTLITEDHPGGIQAFGSGETVGDALISAGIRISRELAVYPDSRSPFTPGMAVEVLRLRELTVVTGGKRLTVSAAGANVGEALARAGLPLMNSDVSIPAAGEPLPSDGRILIVPVTDSFTMNAEAVRRQIEWTADDTLALDETRMIAEGTDGLKGTFSRIRTENGRTVLEETSPESELVSPVNGKQAYGTKISIRTLDTPDGPIEYYRSVPVYATSYSPCRSGTSSCITGTASGRKVAKGVIAVTSSWYKRFGGQSVYVPGYGTAVIADVGGGIPGKNWIDLAYEDDDFVGWSKDTTLYFLTPVPADMVWVLQ